METSPVLRNGLSVIAMVAAYAGVSYLKAAPKLQIVPEPTPAAGETRVAPPGRHFSIVLPAGWVNVDANAPEAVQARRERLERYNATHHTHVKFSESDHPLYAYDPRTSHDAIVRSVGVLIKETHLTKSDPAARAKAIADRMAADVPGLRVLRTDAAELPVGTMPRVVSSFPIAKGASTTTVSYSMADGGRLITLTVTGGEKDRDEVTTLADRIARSFRTLR